MLKWVLPSASRPDGGDTLKEGGQLTQQNSFLFRGRSEVPGMKLEPSRADGLTGADDDRGQEASSPFG